MIRQDLADKSQERWEAWESSLSLAAVEMVMSETVLYEDGFTDCLELGCEESGWTGVFQELPAVGRDLRRFAGKDVLIRELDGFCLHARARTDKRWTSCDWLLSEWLNG